MRVYFLNPPYFPHFGREMRWQDVGRGGTLYYPIWLSYAAGLVESKGHDVRLVDAPAWGWGLDEVLRDISSFSPDLVVIGTSFTSLKNDLMIAKKVKELGLEVAIVGPPTSQFPEEMLEIADYVARYEYDYIVLELAEGRRPEEISGLSFRKGDSVVHNPNRPWIEDLDSLPFVTKVYKERLNIYDYFLNYSLYPMVQIFTGRGCPFHCTFCAWPQTFMGRKYRVRSVDNVLDELEWVEAELPKVKEVFFEDDTFTIDRRRVREFSRKYGERGLRLAWSCNARVGTLDLETLKEMRKTNCRFLIVGFESANNEVLRNIKKGFTVEMARKFAENVRKAGLMLHADFIIGLPGETKETIKMTKKFIKEIKPDLLQVSVVAPFPGTELFKWLEENGYLLTTDPNEYLDEMGHQKSIVSYPWLTAEEITRAVDEILKEYYLSIRYIPRLFRQIFRKTAIWEIQRLIKSARVFLTYVRERT